MGEIANIRINEYFTCQDRQPYDYLLKYSENSKDVFKLGDLVNRPFGVVKDFQHKMNNGISVSDLIEFIESLTKCNPVELCKHKITDLIYTNAFVRKQMEFINSLEESNLISPYDATAEEAGVDRFNKFGYLTQLDSLAGGDITKYQLIRDMPYMDCFTKLLLEKDKAEFNNEVQKIISRKHGKV